MLHRRLAALAAAGGLLLAAPQAFADDVVKTGFGIALEGAAEFGGDEIVTIYYEDGDDQDIKAGQGITLAAGVHYTTASAWDFRGTFGYKFTSSEASNADVSFSRYVIEAVADYFITERFFVGAGITHHSSIEFDADGLGDNFEFDDAIGFTVEAGWSFIAVSYTAIDYEAFGTSVDAGNFGVSLIARF